MRGFPGVINSLLLGVTIGGVAALVLLVVMRKGRKYRFAYAPYLAAGAVLSLFLS
jgi:prepilin signal peptidase PulO-like enzyme (type II secretory pathway)